MEERLLALIRLAKRHGASDIHIENKASEVIIQMRINGKLMKVKTRNEDKRLLRYLQYLSSLDVGKILQPQSGQFELELDGILVSLRFSIIYMSDASYGVLRILNPEIKIDSSNLSSIKEQNDYFKNLLNYDCGLILFSGPTGSGKTTTLYSLLKDAKNKKIYTIEDPIEVYNDKFVQLQINENIGMDYEAGIRQILRHDPDIIMIGEIRDEKAAKMAVVAANTGHLVLSSIHASFASSVISRMSELGVKESYLYEVLICSANQRMMIDKNGNKLVLYEIMDQEEIEYYHQHKSNSKRFLSINKQISDGMHNGTFE